MDEIIEAAKNAVVANLEASLAVANGETNFTEDDANSWDVSAAYAQAASIAMQVLTLALHNESDNSKAEGGEFMN